MFTSTVAAQACDTAACLVDPEELALTQTITFDDIRLPRGPGYQTTGFLVMQDAVFGERFAGQSVAGTATRELAFDNIRFGKTPELG